MSLPRAVQQAGEQAEAIYQQVYPTETETTEQEAPAEPEVVDSQEPVAEAELAPAKQEEDTWEHRYKVLEGKYRAEVPRLAADIRDLKSKLQSSSEELERAKKQSVAKESLVTPEERERFGEDLLSVISRAAEEKLRESESRVATLEQELRDIRNQSQKATEVGFYDQIGKLVPDWVTVNDSPDFHRWLAEYDEFTGETRQELLIKAEAARDADRVARFFTAWKRQQESMAGKRQRELEAQVAPDSRRAGNAPSPKRYFARAEIADIYSRIRRGEYTAKQQVAIEAEIQTAMLEGRIR